MALCRAALYSVVPIGVLCAVCGCSPPQAWRCVVLPSVVSCPSGCFVRCVAGVRRKLDACVPVSASVTHSGRIIDRHTSQIAGAWLGPGVCLVQAALQGAAHTNHVVGETGCPLTGWWLPGCTILLPEL